MSPERKAGEMLETAHEFFLAGERLGREMSLDDYGLHTVPHPTMVCYAFSSEICLKLLLFMKTNKIDKTHDLEKLIYDFQINYQDSSLDFYKRFRGISLIAKRNDGSSYVIRKSKKEDFYFAFINYRYPFDFTTTEYPYSMLSFCLSCLKKVRQYFPDLNSRFNLAWADFENNLDYRNSAIETGSSRKVP
jgi:hypothetical protein